MFVLYSNAQYAGLHAREHLSPAVGLFLLYNYAIRSNLGPLLNFHILTMANPDGYDYSLTNGPNDWRKNRQTYPGNECVGVDLNRNFGFHWGESGTSNDSCSDIYGGPKPFSELESKAIRDYLENLPELPTLAVDIHAYGNELLFPFGFAKRKFPKNINEILTLGNKAVVKVPKMVLKHAASNCKFSLSKV